MHAQALGDSWPSGLFSMWMDRVEEENTECSPCGWTELKRKIPKATTGSYLKVITYFLSAGLLWLFNHNLYGALKISC